MSTVACIEGVFVVSTDYSHQPHYKNNKQKVKEGREEGEEGEKERRNSPKSSCDSTFIIERGEENEGRSRWEGDKEIISH